MVVVYIFSTLAGIFIILAVLLSAVQTVVLPGGGMARITRFVFAMSHRLLIRRRDTGRWRRSADLYGPVGLVSLPFVWAFLVTIGFALVYYGLRVDGLSKSFVLSGSSLLTLGFSAPGNDQIAWITFVEATIGLGLVTLLISYLPTIYTSYSNRERGVALLRPLTGTPPDAVELLCRLHLAGGLGQAGIWQGVTAWFADLDQSHGSFPVLCWFRPHRAGLSWVSAAGVALDATALVLSVVDTETDPWLSESVLVLAQGAPALVAIGQAAGLPLADAPTLAELRLRADEPPPPISIEQAEFDAAVDSLRSRGVVVRDDADAAWRRFAWLRSCYDEALRGLAGAVDAPPAPWTTDRPAVVGRPRLLRQLPLKTDFTVKRA